MRRLLGIAAGLAIAACLAMGFGWIFIWWTGLSGAQAGEVLLLYVAAVILLAGLFVAGELIPARSLAYYVVAGGAVFLAVDVIVWWHFGIMPAARFVRGGFVPAAIVGLVIGVIYRVVAVPTAALPRDPPA